MPTTNTNFSTLITAIDTKAQSLAASTTDPKDLVFLGKAVEALNVADTVSAVISEGDTQIAAVQAEGTTQVAAVAAQGANYAPLAGATFTGAVSGTDLTLSGNLTVSGTTTTINTATLDVADLNITVADGAADAAAADGAGLTVDGASATFNYASSGDKWTMNKPLDITGYVAANELSQFTSIREKVTLETSQSGTFPFDVKDGNSVVSFVNSQQANRDINIRGNSSTTLNNTLAVGDSVSVALLFRNGTTAYYVNGINVDGVSQTVKWQGGSAPTAGNASSTDVYTITVIKTAPATFTVLASQTQFA